MLTIDELASYAGVTVRAVRHDHAKGLPAEPPRDRSGYRRYPAAAVVELIKIRTPADPGLVDFYRTLGRALDRDEDDPGLVELADRMPAYLTRLADERGEDYLGDDDLGPPLATLSDALAFDTAPAARRLAELLARRGWRGWTRLERVAPGS